MNLTTLFLAITFAADPGVLPTGADGKPLNLDFETGTLKDWTATGQAFEKQPIDGDTVVKRRGDMKSEHQGRYWVGSYEIAGDKVKGTLTSAEFKITHPWASFLVGGGTFQQTRVELIDVKTGEAFFTASGQETENMARVAVDLSTRMGRTMKIRLVDNHSGGWGHLNFDDFRFHTAQPELPKAAALTPEAIYKFNGQAPNTAAKNMTVPPGFSVSLFAGEPDLHQPIAMCFDDRGRLWVIEAYCYPRRNAHPGPIIPDAKLGDKILIFEDTNGDGKFDKKTTFLEGLNLASGIEYGFGGIWVGAAPYFLYIPVLDGDKAGEPKILLDGWGYEDTHETLNSFVWGPDGWLYGCHGVFTHSKVGKPGTPAKERIPINAGIWRYHPVQHTFQIYAHGTSNPWGLDYNAVGDFFIEACVIPHLWHIVPGGRYQRQAGSHFNPHAYSEIATIAKHRHYQGNQWNVRDRASSDDLGGGHAHSGLVCYQGGTWPKDYHGKLFMGNIHGHRINVDVVTPKGSSYEGDRNPDFLLSHDRTCIIVAIQTGPDGNLFFSDWSDKQVCHRNEPAIWDRTNGRVFKVSHESTKPVIDINLAGKTDQQLFELQTSDNEWMVRHSRQLLMERAPSFVVSPNGEMSARAKCFVEQFNKLLSSKSDRDRLRGVWLAHACGAQRELPAEKLLTDSSPHVRAWSLLTAVQDRSAAASKPNILGLFSKAAEDASPIVRRAMVSAMLLDEGRAFDPSNVRSILAQMIREGSDANDPVLPNLYWNALEPHGGIASLEALDQSLAIAANGKVPALLPWMARRVAALDHPMALNALVSNLSRTAVDDHRIAYLDGILQIVRGRAKPGTPPEWEKAYVSCTRSDSETVKTKALAVAVFLGDAKALSTMRDILANKTASTDRRLEALTNLSTAKDPQLQPVLVRLLDDADLRGPALRALAAYDDTDTANTILNKYSAWPPKEKRDALATLSSRKSYSIALIEAAGIKKIPQTDLTADVLRQMRQINDVNLNKRIAEVYGMVRETAADRKKLIGDWSKKLTPKYDADLSHGRAIFAKVCQTCHTLYGLGGNVGPDITGSNRADLGYLLENILDPSAVIPKEYAASKIELADGRVITGIIKNDTGTMLTVVTANETMTIPSKDVEKKTVSDLSMMPDDVVRTLNESELKNLVAYLRHPKQVPITATADNVKEFFNGKDLTGWDMDETAKELNVFSVQNGEIVGQSKTGLKRNTFLTSQLEVSDFKLSLKMKLVPNTENSGIQIRSVRIDNGEMKGPQCDAGKGWWGKLYEESARGLLWKEDADQHVKVEDWNEYVIEAKGDTIKTWLNGKPCVNLKDEKLSRKGLIGLQVHSGKGPIEVRFKDLKLEVIEAK